MSRYVGCAGWSIPAVYANRFPDDGRHLERYSHRLSAVEINSSFYRPHRPDTYRRWAASVPDDFRFSVKMPKVITHTQRLVEIRAELDQFLLQIACLESKLGPILVQLPPSLRFAEDAASHFFHTLRERFSGGVVCEPRHGTWFTPEGADLLKHFQVARVGADPPRSPKSEEPGGWRGMSYYRLHGSPKIYVSDYDSDRLGSIEKAIRAIPEEIPVWCIFDNTAEGAATGNALEMQKLLSTHNLVEMNEAT